jgi:hypothetical protein
MGRLTTISQDEHSEFGSDRRMQALHSRYGNLSIRPKQPSERGGVSMDRSNGCVHLRRSARQLWQGSGILAVVILASKTARCADRVIGRAKASSAEANRLMLRRAYHPAVAEVLATQRAARPAPYPWSVKAIRADTEQKPGHTAHHQRPTVRVYLRLRTSLLDISNIQSILLFNIFIE